MGRKIQQTTLRKLPGLTNHGEGTACQTGLEELHGINSVTKITRKKTSTTSKVAGRLSNDDSMTGHYDGTRHTNTN